MSDLLKFENTLKSLGIKFDEIHNQRGTLVCLLKNPHDCVSGTSHQQCFQFDFEDNYKSQGIYK